MKRSLLLKLLLLACMGLAILVPLLLIEAQISTRQELQKKVLEEIASTAAGEQQLNGPVLQVHYVRTEVSEEKEDGHTVRKTVQIPGTFLVPPRHLDLEGAVGVEERRRGIYHARLFTLRGTLRASFDLAAEGLLRPGEGVTLGRASLLVGMSDLRGLQSEPVLQVDGRSLPLRSRGGTGELAPGLEADLGPVADLRHGDLNLALDLTLLGTERLSVAPAAGHTRVHLTSPWPDPSFGGRFLPVSRTVTRQGFDAVWQVPGVARNRDKVLVNGDSPEHFYVTFTEPVNSYLQAERAVKYGILFVVLTFAALFLFEAMAGLRIHPFQYLLAGLALAVFFLLLVGLSEHMPFPAAYGASALACVVLLGGYLAAVLKARSRTLGFSGGLVALYGVLYAILASEDNAFVMGSLLVFCMLAAFMVATRRLDWYQVGTPQASVPPPLPDPPME